MLIKLTARHQDVDMRLFHWANSLIAFHVIPSLSRLED